MCVCCSTGVRLPAGLSGRYTPQKKPQEAHFKLRSCRSNTYARATQQRKLPFGGSGLVLCCYVAISQVKSLLALLEGKKAICRCGGPRAQGLVRVGVVPTTPPVSQTSPA